MHHGHERLGNVRRSVQDVRESLGGERLGLRGETWDQMRQQSVSHPYIVNRPANPPTIGAARPLRGAWPSSGGVPSRTRDGTIADDGTVMPVTRDVAWPVRAGMDPVGGKARLSSRFGPGTCSSGACALISPTILSASQNMSVAWNHGAGDLASRSV